MKTNNFLPGLAVILICGMALAFHLHAAPPTGFQTFEYATIRWAGRENTHVIRPGGHVENAGPQLMAIKKPDRTDDRAFYMNIVMNALAKEGYEFAGMTSDEIVMRRATH
jgi:hypothetical protein